MNNINHKDMVKALAKDGADVILGLTPLSAHLLHMAVGLSGEISELIENHLEIGDHENKIEEFGDIEFYFEGIVPHLNFRDEIELTERDVSTHNADRELLHLAKHGGALLDAIKKSAIYVKDLDINETVTQMINIRQSLCNLYWIFNITPKQAIEANIAKLGKRYEGFKYSNEAAQTHADRVERRVFIFGEQACGKTHHSKALAEHFGCSEIFEADEYYNKDNFIPFGSLVLSVIAPECIAVGDLSLPFIDAMKMANIKSTKS